MSGRGRLDFPHLAKRWRYMGHPLLEAGRNLGRPKAVQVLALYDFAGLDAAGADLDALGATGGGSLDGLKVRVPAATRHVVRVRDVVTKLGALAAKLTYLCHDASPKT